MMRAVTAMFYLIKLGFHLEVLFIYSGLKDVAFSLRSDHSN